MHKDRLLNFIKSIEDSSVLDYLSQYHELEKDIFKTHDVIICGLGNSMIKDLIPRIKYKMNIIAIIDDALKGNYFNDIDIFGSEYLDKIDTSRLVAISGVFSKDGVKYFKQLMESKNIQLVQFDLVQYFLNVKLQYDYYNDLIENTIRHKDKLFELFDTLNDDKSKEVLENLLMYRLTLDKKYIKKLKYQTKNSISQKI